jgi:hypothetical protein
MLLNIENSILILYTIFRVIILLWENDKNIRSKKKLILKLYR